MFGWLRKRPMLDPGSSEWIIDAFGWALQQFGTDYFRDHTVLVTPSNRHFPDRIGDNNALVTRLFARVQAFAGMQDWPCWLAQQEADPSVHVAPTLLVKGAPQGPAGTFRMRAAKDGTGRHALITFNPSQVSDPEALIATFAHELAHYLAHSVAELPPGGEEFEELATDVLAVVMGFGLFIANSSFRFRQYQGGGTQGWSTRHQATCVARRRRLRLRCSVCSRGFRCARSSCICRRGWCRRFARLAGSWRGPRLWPGFGRSNP